MLAGVGPGSWAERPDIPDITFEKHDRMVRMRVATDFTIEPRDPDPRGMPVLGADGVVGGKVIDAWVDRSEYTLRYLEFELASADNAATDDQAKAARRGLLPIAFAEIDKANGKILVNAILGKHFANVPTLRKPDQVTLLEEDKIAAYYGGGLLYATADRQEPLL